MKVNRSFRERNPTQEHRDRLLAKPFERVAGVLDLRLRLRLELDYEWVFRVEKLIVAGAKESSDCVNANVFSAGNFRDGREAAKQQYAEVLSQVTRPKS
jgi:hypothetical protein